MTPRMKIISVVVFMSIVFAGCATTIKRYGISSENVENLKALSSQTSHKINIKRFTVEGGKQKIKLCRGTAIFTPLDGKTFEQYITDAFISEFTLADIYSEDSALN